MKIVIQRVQKASVAIEDRTVGAIKQGLLLLVGVGPEDTREDLDYAVRKIVNMRIFSDEAGKMNLSVKDVGGQILSISQFTLFADTKKGNRPAFTGAAKPDMASQLYDDFNQSLSTHVPVERGRFGADMQVSLVNDGPVTIILDTKNRWLLVNCSGLMKSYNLERTKLVLSFLMFKAMRILVLKLSKFRKPKAFRLMTLMRLLVASSFAFE